MALAFASASDLAFISASFMAFALASASDLVFLSASALAFASASAFALSAAAFATATAACASSLALIAASFAAEVIEARPGDLPGEGAPCSSSRRLKPSSKPKGVLVPSLMVQGPVQYMTTRLKTNRQTATRIIHWAQRLGA